MVERETGIDHQNTYSPDLQRLLGFAHIFLGEVNPKPLEQNSGVLLFPDAPADEYLSTEPLTRETTWRVPTLEEATDFQLYINQLSFQLKQFVVVSPREGALYLREVEKLLTAESITLRLINVMVEVADLMEIPTGVQDALLQLRHVAKGVWFPAVPIRQLLAVLDDLVESQNSLLHSTTPPDLGPE